MVHVEQDALRAFEQDPPAAQATLVEITPDWLCKFKNEIGDLGKISLEPLAINGWLTKACAKRVVVSAEAVELRSKLVKVSKIANPDCSATDLVLVRGTDAAARCSNLSEARRIFAKRVEVAVDGEDQRAGLGDHQDIGAYLDTKTANSLDFGLQCPWIKDHAIADDRGSPAHDP